MSIGVNYNMYKAEKDRICTEFIKVIEKRFKEVKGKIKVTDVATPVTYNRYTGVWRGSYLGWSGTVAGSIPTELLELRNLYIAGQWTRPSGGISSAMMSGKECITKILQSN